MGLIASFYHSTVGKKIIMALSGLVLVLFLLGHMAGNLKMFAGADSAGVYKMDHYAEMLRLIGADFLGRETFLWIARGGLLLCVVLHFTSAFQLAALNRAARPVGYHAQNFRSANAASRTMLYGGVLILIFIVFHLLHLTTGHLHFRGFQEGQVYANVWNAFQAWGVVVFYVATMAAIGLHLFHGIWSMFQTLGVDTPRWNSSLRSAAAAVSILLFLGFSAVPVSVLLRALPAPSVVVATKSN